jgi:hypothetical protein
VRPQKGETVNASKQNAEKAITKVEEVKRRCVPAKDEAAHKHLQFVLDFLGRAKAKLPNEESFPKPDKDGGDQPEPTPAPKPVEGEQGPDPTAAPQSTSEAGPSTATATDTPNSFANPHGKARGKKS